jgi:hypothetical protein
MITRRIISRVLVALRLHCAACGCRHALPRVCRVLCPGRTCIESADCAAICFQVAFLLMAWSWIVLAPIALVVMFWEARLGKPITLICGFAVLIQAVFAIPMVGFFIGNEMMIGAASLLMIIGGFLFHGSRFET